MFNFLQKEKGSKSYLWFLMPLVLFAYNIRYRILHFNDALMDPHRWRQGDTYYFIYNFWKNGVDLLHPAVCWMGGHKTLAFEFPLPEALAAWWWHLMGKNQTSLQVFFLLCFALSAAYLYLFARKLFDLKIAVATVILYFLSPLAVFYGQAIIIDFFVVALSLGAAWHFLKALDGKKMLFHYSVSAIFATVVFMVKAPIILAVLPLLAFSLVTSPNNIKSLRYSWLAVLPVVGFVWWSRYSTAINAAVPDWSTILPQYGRFIERSRWYFGDIEQRYDHEVYNQIWRYFKNEVVAAFGLFGVFAGVAYNIVKTKDRLILWWFIGCIVYLLVFLNLILIHNYYSIPFIPFAAVSLAYFLNSVFGNRQLVVYALVACYALDTYTFSSETYFQSADGVYITAQYMKQQTADQETIAVMQSGVLWNNPMLLSQAERHGFQLDTDAVTDKHLAKLVSQLNVRHFFEIHNKADTLGTFAYLKPYYKRHWRYGGDWMITEYQVAK